MNEYDINDLRKEKEFSGITFSKFKMTDVKKELTKKYTDMAEKCSKWGEERVERGFLSVAKFMNDADTSHLIPEFKKNIEMVDIIRNENFAALALSIPNKTEVEIVAPDLEIPGSIAIA